MALLFISTTGKPVLCKGSAEEGDEDGDTTCDAESSSSFGVGVEDGDSGGGKGDVQGVVTAEPWENGTVTGEHPSWLLP